MSALRGPHESACLDDAPPGKFTLMRGSPALAWRSYLKPWSQKEGPVWVHLLILLTGNSIVAGAITLFALPDSFRNGAAYFWSVLPFAQSIGTCIMVLHTLFQVFFGEERVRGWPAWVNVPVRLLLATAGVFVGYTIALDVRTGHWGLGVEALADGGFAASVGIALIVSFAVGQIAWARTRAAVARAEIDRERARSAAAESREAAARLQLLQAQIEPHFLFNTLSNVLGMIDSRPRDAKQMLEDFIVYLRASLDATRGSTTDLGRELDLLRRYLSIFQYRMGRRLTYSIECPEALRALPIAPMLLHPLVENAIEHGLEPKIEGGSVSVCVSATPLMVTIAVADTGLGFFGIAGGGVGLANVRERLQLLYGNEAKLVVQEHKPVGTLASISIPAFNLAHSDAASGTRLPPTDGVRARVEVVLKDSEQGGETDFRLSGTGS